MNEVRPTRHDLLAVLEDNGHRVTSPRRHVISLLEGKYDGFSAEQISSELPAVGRATVYRTIKLLLEAGVICKLVLPDGASKYSLARVEHHHHTLCIKCGTVGEFRDNTIERLKVDGLIVLVLMGALVGGTLLTTRVIISAPLDRLRVSMERATRENVRNHGVGTAWPY